MSSESIDRDWVITKFRSIVNPFLQSMETMNKFELRDLWASNFRRYPGAIGREIVLVTTVNVLTDDTPPEQLGNVMNNLMYDFITSSSLTKMNMKRAATLLKDNVNTNRGVIGLFSTGLGMRAWYITCGNWILCNADITPPKAKARARGGYKWDDVFSGGGPEGDIKMYWFTDGATVLAHNPITDSQIYPELLIYPTAPLLNWHNIPIQFLVND